jgi:molybdopterin-guanine dinucleotide biosynthesis protein A
VEYGAVVLCGGGSTRMGLAKATLPFGRETMLARTVRLLGDVVGQIVVVAGPGQDVPELPGPVHLARDRHEGRGPLEGMDVGLSSLPAGVEAAYVTGCDAPFLAPAFVARMFDLLGDFSIAVPCSGGYEYPLAAVYRVSVRQAIGELLSADRLRPAYLFDRVPTRRVTPELVLDVDPSLGSLENVNRPAEYLDALGRAGLSAPPEVLARLRGP